MQMPPQNNPAPQAQPPARGPKNNAPRPGRDALRTRGRRYTKEVPAAASAAHQSAGSTGLNTALWVRSMFGLGVALVIALLWVGVALRFGTPAKPHYAQGSGPMVVLSPLPESDSVLTVPELVQRLEPSVVSIDVYHEGQTLVSSSGSGVVISADGYIVTNAHVIQDATAIRVVLYNGKGYLAREIGRDARSDLAVLKISAHDLTPASFGDSDLVQVGQAVVAIGNPAGILPGSPSLGIISGVNRNVALPVSGGPSASMKLLQTDAAINPGNSGGALVNVYGQVVGINVAKLSFEDSENIGFAIPSNIAQPIIEDLLVHGYIEPPPRLGVSVLPLNEFTGPSQGLPASGLLIDSVEPESSLAKVGIVAGDVILSADGFPTHTPAQLLAEIEKYAAGESIELVLYIASTGEEVTLQAPLYAP